MKIGFNGEWINAVEVFENSAFVLEHPEDCRKAAAYSLMDRLVELGVVKFDVSEEVTLCDDTSVPPSPPRVAVRATINLCAAYHRQNEEAQHDGSETRRRHL